MLYTLPVRLHEGAGSEPVEGSDIQTRRKTMARQRETTYTGIMGELRRFLEAFISNAGELGHLETLRIRVASLLERAHDLARQQAAVTASRQELSKLLRETIQEAVRAMAVLRAAVRDHYGPRSEKLAEFGLQPFRGRKPKTEVPSIEQNTYAATPPASSPDR
jgi:hypothetical protein